MKTIKKLLLGLLLTTGSLTQAQVSVNVNVGTPPAWGPAGYAPVRYYYLPDIATYYDVNTSQYIYVSNKKWIRARALPRAHRNYNLYNGYKVVMTDYNGNAPYVYHNTYITKYPRGYRGVAQHSIGKPRAYAYTGAPHKQYKAVKYKNRGKGHYKHNGKGHHGKNHGHHGRH